MEILLTLLAGLKTDREFFQRKLGLIISIMELDKRFLPLIVSDVYNNAVVEFTQSSERLASQALSRISSGNLAEELALVYAKGGVVIDIVELFIKHNDLKLDCTIHF